MDRTPRTIREQITDRIRERVMHGELSPGEALRESDFAARYQVSRGPVRDAFLRLAQEGWLAYQPNRGVTVRHPPTSEHRELITSLRQQVECFVAKRGLKHLTDEDFGELERRLEDLRRACDAEDTTAVARQDIEFHETLLVLCGGADLLPVWRTLCSQMLMAYERLDDFHAVYSEHEKIFAAARGRRSTALCAALKANIQ